MEMKGNRNIIIIIFLVTFVTSGEYNNVIFSVMSGHDLNNKEIRYAGQT